MLIAQIKYPLCQQRDLPVLRATGRASCCLPWWGDGKSAFPKTTLPINQTFIPINEAMLLQLFVDRVPGTAKGLIQSLFPVLAVLCSVHAGQPRGPAPGRAINWHGSQRAALCLVS